MMIDGSLKNPFSYYIKELILVASIRLRVMMMKMGLSNINEQIEYAHIISRG